MVFNCLLSSLKIGSFPRLKTCQMASRYIFLIFEGVMDIKFLESVKC